MRACVSRACARAHTCVRALALSRESRESRTHARVRTNVNRVRSPARIIQPSTCRATFNAIYEDQQTVAPALLYPPGEREKGINEYRPRNITRPTQRLHVKSAIIENYGRE